MACGITLALAPSITISVRTTDADSAAGSSSALQAGVHLQVAAALGFIQRHQRY